MSKLLNLITLSGLVALGANYGPAPVAAVSIEGLHGSSNLARGHDAIAKRKRGINSRGKKCKPRKAAAAASSEAPKETPKKEEAKPAAAAAPAADNSNNQASSGNSQWTGEFSQLGYAWTMDAGSLSKYKQSKPTLIYNWQETGPNVDGFEFMPMCWGAKNEAAFKAATDKKTPKFALGPNEPELVNDTGLSSGMATDDVVGMYWRVLDPLAKKGVKILTPAVTSGQKGMDWMKDFMGKCKGCNFAGQALHWYDISADAAIKHFNDHHKAFGLDIYCTEIAFNNFNGGNQLSKSQASTEMSKFNEWVKTADFMKVVMYFGFQDDMVNVSPTLKLINGDHSANDLGSMVIKQLSA